MTIVKTNLGSDESARQQRLEPTGTISATNAQEAIEEVANEGAPVAAEYLVGAAHVVPGPESRCYGAHCTQTMMSVLPSAIDSRN